jgi:hypothetical protein
MTKPGKGLLAVAIVIALTVALPCCRKEGPAERAGEKIDKAVEKAGDQIEKAGEKIEDAAKNANKR